MEVSVMTDMNNMELNEKDLENAAGGYQSGKLVYKDGYNCYRVQGVTNFLALRSEPVDSDGVIIGELYNGEEVQYLEACHDPRFCRVYSPRLQAEGYVKIAYLALT